MDLIELSKRAHIVAMALDQEPPVLREDLMSYPIVRSNGVPCFDPSRMRPDQIEDVAAVLRGIAFPQAGKGGSSPLSLEGLVRAYMQAFGSEGVRLLDAAAALQMDKKTVRRHLLTMVEAGEVWTKDEPTRGKSASRRIRYFMREAQRPIGPDGTETRIHRTPRDSGVVLHGAPVHALRCPCGRCQHALRVWERGERETAERRAGRTGMLAGIAVPA